MKFNHYATSLLLSLLLSSTVYGQIPHFRFPVNPHGLKMIHIPNNIQSQHSMPNNPPNSEGRITLPSPSECVAQSLSNIANGIYAYGGCYGPAQIRKAYNVPDNLDGSGQTIVILMNYRISPTLVNDVNVFSRQFGLPSADIEVIYPNGTPTAPLDLTGTDFDGAGEITIDVEWSHAIAPRAKIVVVSAASETLSISDHITLLQYVVDHPNLGKIVSISYGIEESQTFYNPDLALANQYVSQIHQLYQKMREEGMTVLVADGDTGADDYIENGPIPPLNDLIDSAYFYPVGVPNHPQSNLYASDPNVTAVGGTSLFATNDGTYQYETVWNDTIPQLCPFNGVCDYNGATGGGPSLYYKAPWYQQGVTGQTMRTTGDVSLNAGLETGYWLYRSYFPSDWGVCGSGGPVNTDLTDHFNCFENGWTAGWYGTSFSAPEWAGIVALLNQALGHPVGSLNPKLYGLLKDPVEYAAAFHDVTIGSNFANMGQFGLPYVNGPGFRAHKGYDLPTGLGTPNVANLINILVKHDKDPVAHHDQDELPQLP